MIENGTIPNTLTLTGLKTFAAFEEDVIQATAQVLFADATFIVAPENQGDPISFDGGPLTMSGLAADVQIFINRTHWMPGSDFVL